MQLAEGIDAKVCLPVLAMILSWAKLQVPGRGDWHRPG
jgi:hypothetical protein